MGGAGRPVRVLAPLLGSPFTYSASRKGKETAEGQLDAATMQRILAQLEDALK
jgi:3-dehydroquinate dehydratase-1